MNLGDKEFHIAPMIDVSTIEFRYFIRLLTKRAVIWNQMVVAETLVHRHRIAKQNDIIAKESASCELSSSSSSSSSSEQYGEDTEDDVQLTPDLIKYCGYYNDSKTSGVNPHPTICQIGSNIPYEAAFATRIAYKCGYDAIDLNSECPSDRVAGRCFGAALMKDQDTSEQVVNAMVSTSQLLDKPIPISVKCRIGIDEYDTFEFISNYISRLSNVGCTNFIIHARKVYMQGLDPAANRTIPPLNYPIVYQLMKEYPNCNFLHNGGIRSLVHARELAFGSCVKFDDSGNGRVEPSSSGSNNESDSEHVIPCQQCDLPQGSCLHPPRISPANMKGVMVARLARDRPADLADVDRYFYGEPCNPCVNRRQLMDRYIEFLDRVYPRRCCDDDETISLDMMRDIPRPIVPLRSCCNLCREFRGCPNGEEECRPIISIPQTNASEESEASTNNRMPQLRQQSGKRSKRHNKYKGAKIVTRIIDRALQPTWNILAGEKGKRAFVNTSHELSRDKTVRNCGPAYILWKAMKAVPDEMWDKPFELSDEKKTSTYYYPTK